MAPRRALDFGDDVHPQLQEEVLSLGTMDARSQIGTADFMAALDAVPA